MGVYAEDPEEIRQITETMRMLLNGSFGDGKRTITKEEFSNLPRYPKGESETMEINRFYRWSPTQAIVKVEEGKYKFFEVE